MQNLSKKCPKRILASNHFNELLLDCLLARQAMMCTKRTIDWYKSGFGASCLGTDSIEDQRQGADGRAILVTDAHAADL